MVGRMRGCKYICVRTIPSGRHNHPYFTTYSNNIVEVEQDPNKGEGNIHFYFVSDDVNDINVVSKPQDEFARDYVETDEVLAVRQAMITCTNTS
jgi:hypothetical protein